MLREVIDAMRQQSHLHFRGTRIPFVYLVTANDCLFLFHHGVDPFSSVGLGRAVYRPPVGDGLHRSTQLQNDGIVTQKARSCKAVGQP